MQILLNKDLSNRELLIAFLKATNALQFNGFKRHNRILILTLRIFENYFDLLDVELEFREEIHRVIHYK